MKWFVSAAIWVLFLSQSCRAGEKIIQDQEGMNCHVYTPDEIDPDRTYQPVVGVHGANGNGAAGFGKKSTL